MKEATIQLRLRIQISTTSLFGGSVSNISDDKLRELCQRVVSVDGDFTEALSELRAALRDRFGDIANKNAAIMFRMRKPKPGPGKKDGTADY